MNVPDDFMSALRTSYSTRFAPTDASTAPSLHAVSIALVLAQQLVRRSSPPAVHLITSGTLASDAAHAASDGAHGGVWGFGRVLRLEHASVRAQSVDASRGACVSLAVVALGASREAETMWRDGERRVAVGRAVALALGLVVGRVVGRDAVGDGEARLHVPPQRHLLHGAPVRRRNVRHLVLVHHDLHAVGRRLRERAQLLRQLKHHAGSDVLGGAHICREKASDFWPDTT